ncbi:hypothetical protein LX59_03075 [Azomonas agilis]|uniref:Uncharacterized protein n=1 Tax=Azomonas agilis TaxID=116849 RepID=A0A562HZ54_9GAMM|nr:hypothetical protein [Azomonas agilis]TWH63824.1 hypothetical protein LX59_03075 [Azomonas agilis]
MATPADQVDSAFSQAQTYASSAQAKVNDFTAQLQASIYTAPTLSVSWNSIAPPTLEAMPDRPEMPTIAFSAPSGQPTALSLAAPSINVDSFDEAEPEITFPAAPLLSYGTVPSVPDVASIAIPNAPTITTPGVPELLAINTVSFSGLNLHEDWLERLEDMPELSLVAPTPYSYSAGPQYSSEVLTALKGVLAERLRGGGFATVEQALWDRARSRETRTALANEAEILRTSEALGFSLPSGVVAVQIRDAQRNYYERLGELSREVAIQQEESLKHTLEQGMALESQLIDYSYKLEQLTFEHAKTVADNALSIHQAAVTGYNALLSGYQAYEAAYKTLIEGELAKLEVYKAELQAEETKTQINANQIAQYKARIEAGLSQVEIYRAQVGGAQTLVQLEQAKIGAAGEKIRAYVAQINAETAKVEAYKAGVQAQATRVDIYKTKADAFNARVSAQAEQARLELGRYNALVQAKTAEWEGYKVKLQAESTRLEALGRQSTSLLESYQAGTAAVSAQAAMYTKLWETQIKDYESSQYMVLQTARFNSDAINATNAARLDAAKVGAQVYAQLTASAYGMINASASVSAGSSNSVSYSYGGDVSSDVAPKTTA